MGSGEKVALVSWERTPSPRRRVSHKTTYLVASLVLILLFTLLRTNDTHYSKDAGRQGPSFQDLTLSSSTHSVKLPELPCRNLPGANDTVVILKTGSTELQDKLPIHLNTTFRCYPNHIIFSDYEETFQGEHIYDALEYVSDDIKREHPDFELWRRVRHAGRAGLSPAELSGPLSKPTAATGKPTNPGWKLDKWKFLPMVNRTLHEFPDKKWYIFVETDTYIMWQTLLNYLHTLDHKRPYYLGGQSWIGDQLFAHGGTGFAISRPAMLSVVKMFQEYQDDWEMITDGHWAGDCVLAMGLQAVGTNLTEAWPIWQGDDIGQMEYSRVDTPRSYRLWCMPTVSYHHLAPAVVQDLWLFEQDWAKKNKSPSTYLRHNDVFFQYILPRMKRLSKNWDNHADEDRGPVGSLQECAEICKADGACAQYALSTDSRCLSTTTPNLGEYSKGVESGWMVDRVEAWAQQMEPCPAGDRWITSS